MRLRRHYGILLPTASTIFAHSSGAGRAAVAVVRLSGPEAVSALSALTRGRLPPVGVLAPRRLVDPAGGGLLDEGMVVHWRAPRSATGEDTAELHLHGSRAVVAAVSRALARQPGCRPAAAGEFTRRALANGKLGHRAVEGLAYLLNGHTYAQRRLALRALGGRHRAAV